VLYSAGGSGYVGVNKLNPQSSLDISGTLQLNAPIIQNNLTYPINSINTQIGYTMNQSAQTSAGTSITVSTGVIGSLANIVLPATGVWLITYNANVNLVTAAATAGYVLFGLSTTNGTTSPTLANTKFPFSANALLTTSNPLFQSTGFYISTSGTSTYYLNYNIVGQGTAAGNWTTALSTMSATRIA
jgi:hypothetical protein